MKDDHYIPGHGSIKCHVCGAISSPDLTRFNATLKKFVCIKCDEKLENENTQENNHGIQARI